MWKMNDGRKSQIMLLDERRLDIIIQPRLYSNELLDLVASHFKLKEKHYFGLGFYDETSHFNWLQGEKRVLDHDFPKKAGLLILHFAIKFYVDTIGLLRDIQTVELFYLNARKALFQGLLECDSETVFELAAHVLQATNGDFVSEEETREELKKLPVIPTYTLKVHPSIAYCEDRVINFYEKLSGSSRGLAIVNYMTIIEKLPTYGIHYYDVKDKKDIPWWLGISPKGIAVYDKNDKTTPRKLFTWKNLENLYYRDKKFSIEVHGPKRIIHTLSSFNPYEDAVKEPVESYDDLSTAISEPTTQVSVSRRTFGASNVDVHAWFASTPQLTKCIWSMAVVQHQFYLDRKQSRGQLQAARSMSEIAADLCRSTSSLPGSLGSDMSRSPSSHSLPSLSNSRYDLTIEQSDSLKAERDMYQALIARKQALEETLRKKTDELKALCLQEGELTGEVPPETPLAPGEQIPLFRRRVGTAFALSAKSVQDTNEISSEVAKLELEVELQSKITSAAHRLASDKTVSKYVRKQRKQSHAKALQKLKDMEKKLAEMRKKMGKPMSSGDHTHIREYEDPSKISSQVAGGHTVEQGNKDYRNALSPSHSSPQLSVSNESGRNVSTRGHQRIHQFPAAAHASKVNKNTSDTGGAPSLAKTLAGVRLDGSHDSGFSSTNNMYNVTSQRTSHYESTDQLRTPPVSEAGMLPPQPFSHGSVGRKLVKCSSDEPFHSRKMASTSSYLHYGSLDRKRQDHKLESYRDRDVSPGRMLQLRYEDDGSSQPEATAASRGRGTSRDTSTPGGVLPIPVHHVRESSTHSPSHVKYAWGEGPSGAEMSNYRSNYGRSEQGGGDYFSHQHSQEHSYSPRVYEGSSHRKYQDIDPANIHRTAIQHSQSGGELLSPKHGAGGRERSVSPFQAQRSHSQHLGMPHPSSSPALVTDRQRASPQPHYSQSMSPPMSPSAYSAQQPGISMSDSHQAIPSATHHYDMSPTNAGSHPFPRASPSPANTAKHTTSTLVTVTRLQPHTEVSKPYEISDFYRYSERLRRQRIIDQYQRQLIGADQMSRSSSPLSEESDGHSSLSGSASQHSASSSHATQSPNHRYVSVSHNAASFQQIPKGPPQPYNRSASAPLTSLQSPYYQDQGSPAPSLTSQLSSPFPHTQSSHQSSHYSETHMNSPTASYSSYTPTSSMHYTVQSSTRKIHEVHTSTLHTMYQPPQPMTCRPVRNPTVEHLDNQDS